MNNEARTLRPTEAHNVRKGQRVVSPQPDSREYRVVSVKTTTVRYLRQTALVVTSFHDNGKRFTRTITLFAGELVDVIEGS